MAKYDPVKDFNPDKPDKGYLLVAGSPVAAQLMAVKLGLKEGEYSMLFDEDQLKGKVPKTIVVASDFPPERYPFDIQAALGRYWNLKLKRI